MLPFAAPEAYIASLNAPAGSVGTALWFVFRGTELLVAEIDAGLPAHADTVGLGPLRSQYLGTLADRHCYSCEVAGDTPPPPGWVFSGLRQLFGRLEDARFALAGRALQIVDWDRTHQFCGSCGTPTQALATERARQCPVCGHSVYPRLAPAVMALVRRDRQILLARSPRFPEGMYSALAGFVEPGETLEQCLGREVFEEVGIRIRNARYFASQPWPFPHSLMIAFVADHDGGEIAVDGVEIEAAEWFDIALLPRLPAKISIARCLIDAVVGEMLASQSKSPVSARQAR